MINKDDIIIWSGVLVIIFFQLGCWIAGIVAVLFTLKWIG